MAPKDEPFGAALGDDKGFGAALDKPAAEEPEDNELNDKAQEVMNDNLEIMRDIVFRIREDPEVRLFHLLRLSSPPDAARGQPRTTTNIRRPQAGSNQL